MKKHEILSPQSRAALFDPPTAPAAIVRHYTFSPDDLAMIRQPPGGREPTGGLPRILLI
jgi:hypothetical protein